MLQGRMFSEATFEPVGSGPVYSPTHSFSSQAFIGHFYGPDALPCSALVMLLSSVKLLSSWPLVSPFIKSK